MFGHTFLLRRLLLMMILFGLPALACQFSASTASITNAVMVRAVQGDNFDPVDVTDTYPADHPVIHVVVSVSNAPGDTKVKAVWVAVDVGPAAAPNQTLDQKEVTVEGSRNVDFQLIRDSNGWSPGKYKVDIYLNDKLDRTVNFSVEGAPEEAAVAPTAAVEVTATVEPAATTEATATTEEPTATTVVETPEVEPSPTASGPAESIAGAVMASDVTALTSAPLGITDTFPPDQSVVHTVVTLANAPGGTRVKAVWTVIDVGDAAPPNTEIGEYETTGEGSQNLDFIFEAGSDGFPPGTYQVDIYVNGNLERTLNFSVVGEGDSMPLIPTPIVAPVGSCPPLPPPNYQPSGFIRSIIMAQDTQGSDYEPVNPGRVFGPDAIFHAVVAVENAPDNTEVAARWYVQDVGSVEPCNTLITAPFNLTTSGSRNLDFTLQPPSGVQWPVGVYRVEIYTNGNLDLDVTFSVE